MSVQILSVVNCSGSKHRIGLSARGRLAFFGHPDGFKGECRCHEILQAWKSSNPMRLPKGMRDAFRQASSKASERKMSQLVEYQPEPMPSTADEKGYVNLNKLTRKALLKCLPLCKNGLLATVDDVSVSFARWSFSRPCVSLSTKAIEVFPPIYTPLVYDQRLILHISHLPSSWYKDVYKKGLAIIDGHLVLEIVAEKKNATLVMAVQVLNRKRAACIYAEVKMDENGNRKLEWNKEKSKVEDKICVPNEKIDCLAELNCSGKTHKIGISKKGKLIFYNHPNGLKHEIAYEAMGGKSCKCLQFLREWREHTSDSKFFPRKNKQAIKAFIGKNIKLSKQRRASAMTVRTDNLTLSVNERQTIRLHKLTLQAMQKCIESCWELSVKQIPEINLTFNAEPIDRSNHIYANMKYIYENTFTPPSNANTLQYDYKLSLEIANLSKGWLANVYRKGMAIISGHIVLNIRKENGLTYAVLLKRRGCSEVDVFETVIRPKSDGGYSLEFVP